MTDNKVWLVTGAGRGMGVDLAKAALDAGHAVVATGRNPDTVKQAVGDHEGPVVARFVADGEEHQSRNPWAGETQ